MATLTPAKHDERTDVVGHHARRRPRHRPAGTPLDPRARGRHAGRRRGVVGRGGQGGRRPEPTADRAARPQALDVLRHRGPRPLRRPHRRYPELGVLVLTTFLDENLVLRAVRAGARGYVVKDVDTSALIRAIRDVTRGESAFDARSAAAMVRGLNPRRSTPRPSSSPPASARCSACWPAACPTATSARSSTSRRPPRSSTSATSCASSACPAARRRSTRPASSA